MSQPSNQSPEEVRNAAKPVDSPNEPVPGGSGDKKEVPVKSGMPENATGHLNPSAPEDANVTPGSSTVK